MDVRRNNRGDGVLCVGRIYCDIIFTGLEHLPVLGEEHFASGLSIQAGGGAYITASHLSSLQRPVSLLATLPSGPFSNTIRSELQSSGIDIEHCVTSKHPNDLQLTVSLSIEGERAFVTKRSGSALPMTKIDWQKFPQIGHLHIGELATLIDHPTLVENAHNAGVTVSLDCSWDDALFERDDLVNYLQRVDVFLPNQSEFEHMKNVYCRADDLPLCVVKQGNQGATAFVNGESVASPAIVVDVKDTTGAGDAFNAGFIHAWLNNLGIEQCLELGNQCGSNSVSRVGGAACASESSEIQRSSG